MSYSWHKIGERIRNNRIEHGWTQEQLAEIISTKIGRPLKRQTLAGWENGAPIKKIEQLCVMCELFECDMSYLLCECPTKRHGAQPISSFLGISEKAINTLITAANENNPLLPILSALIEDSRNPFRELDGGHNILEAIGIATSMNYGPGFCNHIATFTDAFTQKESTFYISPCDIYAQQLNYIHKAIDNFIAEIREKNNLPDYEY